MGMGLASESYLRISSLRECYRVVSLRKPYEISMLKTQEYDVSRNPSRPLFIKNRSMMMGQSEKWVAFFLF